ncbi:MAG TPA: AgmX/PglI C-terminal domain-containing protein [Nitrospirota bacterium]
MNTSTLAEELEQLNLQIEQARKKHDVLVSELRPVEAELESFSAERQRFDALRDACNAFDKLKEMKADELFWGGISEAQNNAGSMERARGQIASFEGEIGGILEKQASLKQQINQCLDELDILEDEVRNAYDREERRLEEYIIEREISSVPYREMIMPWTRETESEKRFRRYASIALLLCFFLSTSIALIKLPVLKPPPLVVVPERLVSLLKKEPPKPVKVRKPVPKQVREAPGQAKKEPTPRPDQVVPEKTSEPAVAGGGSPAPRKKAETAGVLAFKEAFRDLMKETPVARLGTEARLSNEDPRVKGGLAQRSLVSMVGGSSGGIGGAGVSRNVGSGKGGRGGGYGGYGVGSGSGGGSGDGVGFARVGSPIAGLGESSRPTSDGLALGRTDEEIQIVFDRYKASLYRIYNQELRKDPTLRGKILMRLSIEPDGAVSLCKVESTELASPELVDKIVDRIRRFNFGPKEGVQKVTILYPIDFLPAG